MKLRWFLSGTVREATSMCNHVRKLSSAQRDLLSQEAVSALDSAQRATQIAIDEHADNETLRKRMGELEEAANKWLKPYPHSEWRENVEVFLVAIAIAMAIRTFFLQPFKIPTGSMQPTLYGVEYEFADTIPNQFGRIWDACVRGTFYHRLVAEADGQILAVGGQEHLLRVINKQQIVLEYKIDDRLVTKTNTLWFTPDEDQNGRFRKSFQIGRKFNKGDNIISVKEIAGDHLFVDRLTYNFRAPTRGEIIVFRTKGIEGLQQDQFYIKRLVGLAGENISIGDDQHLRINGVRLDASTPHFGNLYSFDPIPSRNHFFGHVNETVAQKVRHSGLAPFFPNEESSYEIPPKHYMVMGDNTLNSLDSRGWGPFPRENVIGKSFFVYWPISNHGESRFGWGHTAR